MFKKTNGWLVFGSAILFIAAFVALSLPKSVSAASIVNNSNNSCLSCHENLYYLHDTGCWYCMTEPHKDRCTDCHEGSSTSYKVEDAHLRLLPHPQENNGEKCRQCHTEDVQARLDTFAAEGGFRPVIKADKYTPSQPVQTGFSEPTQSDLPEKLSWMTGGIILFGFWLALVLRSPQKP